MQACLRENDVVRALHFARQIEKEKSWRVEKVTEAYYMIIEHLLEAD